MAKKYGKPIDMRRIKRSIKQIKAMSDVERANCEKYYVKWGGGR